MEKVSDALIASTFQKVKDVDIFSLKAYMEATRGAETGVQAILLDIFVNLPFFILNLVVGFFSIILRFFESFSLYDTYRQTVFNASKKLWESLSGSGNYNNSLLYLLVAISAFSIFISFLFSKGDFSRRLIHLFVVILLGMGYFGTVQSTSGGVYILDTVHQMADSFSDSVTHLAIARPDGEKGTVSEKSSIAEDYIMKTSYTAYLYVNTGQLNGSFHNNQTGKDDKLDNSQILGKYDKSGKFIQPKSQDVLNYVNRLGDGAIDGAEKNRWFSAVNDFLWLKFLYVICKTIEAIILAVPLLLIQIIAFIADIVVIILIFIFPLALLVSFLPKMQDVVFNILKVMFGAVSFPALAGFLTLIVFYTQTLIAGFIKDKFTSGKLLTSSNLKGQSILFMLVITVVVQGVVFYAIWKYKEQFLKLILGSKTAQVVSQSADKVAEKADNLGITPKSMYEKAHDMSSVAMMGAGFGAGAVMNAQDNWNAFKEKHSKGSDESDPSDDYDKVGEEKDLESLTDDNLESDSYDSSYRDPNLSASDSIDGITDKNNYEEPYMTDYPSDYQSDLSEMKPEGQAFDEEPYADSSSIVSSSQQGVDLESERLKNQGQSPLQQHKINKLEGELNNFTSDSDYFKAHGKNAFQKGFNASKSKDVRLKHNLERKSKVLEELEKLRGGK
ncbi:hypothetical protein MP619_01690 [Streptococcus dysgalactiae]|uniref:Conjugal transfer protein n=1 Tax=Streptococcus dysgalactiae TaxID=1334 RepID=A0AAE9ZZM8_STRDY|nr:hypothetical protein [Streptococcus dysgalactiae]WAI93350.1 hypothetical protein MP619_01690 [Streptococcus dysgalactiae]